MTIKNNVFTFMFFFYAKFYFRLTLFSALFSPKLRPDQAADLEILKPSFLYPMLYFRHYSILSVSISMFLLKKAATITLSILEDINDKEP
jgi:hypothetical protein